MKLMIGCLLVIWIGVSIYAIYNSKIINEIKMQQIERQIKVREIEGYKNWDFLIYENENY